MPLIIFGGHHARHMIYRTYIVVPRLMHGTPPNNAIYQLSYFPPTEIIEGGNLKPPTRTTIQAQFDHRSRARGLCPKTTEFPRKSSAMNELFTILNRLFRREKPCIFMRRHEKIVFPIVRTELQLGLDSQLIYMRLLFATFLFPAMGCKKHECELFFLSLPLLLIFISFSTRERRWYQFNGIREPLFL